ncbi:uncharacterized protein LOC135351421 isoform X2 [Halichondria panicea]|uniref:uncharacterized protein LOC135351421 isoform X2 n=1 Tax=Halichondria panicea TaxID=6063 RepID=UPI00312B3368
MKYLLIKHRFLDIVLGGLCILPFLSTGIQGISPTVNLTVEGGVSLVGEHCPGTIRLFCEGVDLTTLRWRYNGDNVIYSFSTTDLPINSVTTNPAFINVELKFVASTPNDERFGNFVSVLTADIAQLQSQNVGSINCGDPGTIDTEPVNIRILQPSIPITPRVSLVVATYHSGTLRKIDVSWIKLEEDCPEFAATVVYELRLTGVQSRSLTANQTSCRSELCDESFSLNFSGKRANVTGYNLSLRARNNIGSSEAVMYQLKQQSNQYFSTEINATNCPSLRTQCVSEDSNLRNTTCSVSYGTDPTFMDLPNNINSSFDTPFTIAAGLSSNTTFFLAYSTPVRGLNAIILIVIRETLTTDVCEHGPNVASIVAPTVIILILLFIIGVVVFCCARKKIKHAEMYTCNCEKDDHKTEISKADKESAEQTDNMVDTNKDLHEEHAGSANVSNLIEDFESRGGGI